MDDEAAEKRFHVRIGDGVRVAAIVFVVAVIVAAADRALIAPETVGTRGGVTPPAAERTAGDSGRIAPGAHAGVRSAETASNDADARHRAR